MIKCVKKMSAAVLPLLISAVGLFACSHTHSFDDSWSFDASGHWHAAACGHENAETVYSHEYIGDFCTVCGYKKAHEHALVFVENEPATCTSSGNIEHWACTGCGRTFEDCDGRRELYRSEIEIKQLPHIFDDEYSKDDEYHWLAAECDCDAKKDKARHSLVNGECIVCLYRPGFTDVYYDGVRYTLDEGGQSYSVTGNILDDSTSIALRAEIEGKPVTAVSDDAFVGCAALTSVTLPDTVERIGEKAFYFCTRLASIVIDANVKSIGELAFYGCAGMRYVAYQGDLAAWCDIEFDGMGANPLCLSDTETRRRLIVSGEVIEGELIIPDTVKEIKPYAFVHCGVTGVVLPDSVARVGECAFWADTVTSLTFGRGIEEIGDEAFRSSALARVDVPDLDMWLRIKFGEGSANPLVNSWHGSEPSHDIKRVPEIYFGGARPDGEITIKSGVTSVPAYTFKNSNITRVNIADGVTEIGEGAFFKCESLTAAELPDSVTNVNRYAFYGCAKLAPPTMRGVIAADDYAFYGCFKNAETLELGERMRTIGKYAFARTGIKSMALAAHVQEIDATAFYQTFYLDGITVAESNPNYAAYGNCIIDKRDGTLVKGCKSSVIPTDGSVTAIGDYALAYCELTDVTLAQSIETIGKYAFCGNDFTSFTVPDGVTSIGEYAFDDCRKLVDLTIPDSVTRMPDLGNFYLYNNDAFEYDADGALYIGNHLIDARQIEGEYTIKDGTVTVGGARVFFGVTDLTVPDSVVYIAPDTLYMLDGLTRVTLGKGITVLYTNMFSLCTALTTVRISGEVTEIEELAFGIRNLTDLYFDGDMQKWESVKKHENWYGYKIEFTVHCTDGDIAYGSE